MWLEFVLLEGVKKRNPRLFFRFRARNRIFFSNRERQIGESDFFFFFLNINKNQLPDFVFILINTRARGAASFIVAVLDRTGKKRARDDFLYQIE